MVSSYKSVQVKLPILYQHHVTPGVRNESLAGFDSRIKITHLEGGCKLTAVQTVHFYQRLDVLAQCALCTDDASRLKGANHCLGISAIQCS